MPDSTWSIPTSASRCPISPRTRPASCASLAGRDGVALLVGGTGLYLRAVARGVDLDALPDDPAVRARLEAEFEADGLAPLVTRLGAIAPTLAAGTDLANPRRVIRALEIAELRGDGPRPAPRGYGGPSVWLGLDLPVADHRRRMARAREQFDAGLIDEAVGLRERYDPRLPAFSAIGYREAWAVADGAITREAAIELMPAATPRSRAAAPGSAPNRMCSGWTPRTRSTRPSSSSDASSPRPTSGCQLRLIDDVADPVDA